MAIDGTIREANLRDSIKKYLVDSLYTGEGIQLTFDKGLSTPRVQGTEVDRWVAVVFGEIGLDTLSSYDITLFCCTKKDSEGFKLAQLRDKVMGYLIDTDKTDTAARITLWRSSATEAWVSLGAMVVGIDSESPQMETDDGTKFKTIAVRLRWAGKC